MPPDPSFILPYVPDLPGLPPPPTYYASLSLAATVFCWTPWCDSCARVQWSVEFQCSILRPRISKRNICDGQDRTGHDMKRKKRRDRTRQDLSIQKNKGMRGTGWNGTELFLMGSIFNSSVGFSIVLCINVKLYYLLMTNLSEKCLSHITTFNVLHLLSLIFVIYSSVIVYYLLDSSKFWTHLKMVWCHLLHQYQK